MPACGLSSVELAPLTGAHDLLGVCHSGWPIEVLSKGISNKGLWGGVMPTDSYVNVGQELLILLNQDAALQNLRLAASVQLLPDQDATEEPL